MQLNADNVTAVVKDSLFRTEEVPDGKPPDDAVIVDGVMGKFGFHKQRLETHREDVVSMLKELPEAFRITVGGGWTFLNMCMTRDDRQWGEQTNVNDLCCLAIGLGVGKWLLPRDMWPALPGGMPYVGFDV